MGLKSCTFYFIFLILTTLVLNAHGSCSEDNAFSNDFMAVEFSPQVHSIQKFLTHFYSEEDVLTMTKLVSGRFKKLLIATGSYKDMDVEKYSIDFGSTNIKSIANQIAHLNKAAAKNSNASQIEIILWTSLETDQTLPFKLISEINAIYPTITSVLLQLEGYELYLESTHNFLQLVQRNLSKANISLGLKLTLDQCDFNNTLDTRSRSNKVEYLYDLIDLPDLPPGVQLPPRLKPLLKYINYLVFSPEKVYVFPKPEQTINRVITQLSLCQKAVQNEIENLTVHLNFKWSSEKDLNYFLKVWKLIGNWAEERKTLAFMKEAFDYLDNPLISQAESDESNTWLNHLGWWRLKNPDNLSISIDAFQEKVCDAKFHQNTKQGGTDKTYFSTPFVIMGIFIISILFTVLIVVAYSLVKGRVIRNVCWN